MDIENVVCSAIDELKKYKKIFHSEDDFKFNLAIILKKKLNTNFDVLIEKAECIEL